MAWAGGLMCAAFVAVFVLAAVGKLLDRAATVESLIRFGVPAGVARRAWWLLPVAELTIAVLLVFDSTRLVGALLGIAMLLVFTAALAVQVRRGSRADCNCFGTLVPTPIGPRLIVRNVVLVVLGIGVAFTADELRWSGWVADLDDTERVLFAVAAAALAVSLGLAITLRRVVARQAELARSVQLVEELFDQRELQRAVPQAQPPAPPPGLGIGVLAPPVPGLALDDGVPSVLVFTSANCPACKELAPLLPRWAEASTQLRVVVLTSGPAGQANGHGGPVRLVEVPDETGVVATSYQATWTPGAVVIGGNGRVASRPSFGVAAIDELVTWALASEGELTASHVASTAAPGSPSSRVGRPLPDVAQRDALFAQPSERVLVFWQETCGFCQRFAPELLALEADRPAGVPPFVVVSQQVPSHEFTSPVVLDEDGSIARLFGSHGTPSAVLVDERGRIASDVAAGAPEIRRLLGVLERVPVTLEAPARHAGG